MYFACMHKLIPLIAVNSVRSSIDSTQTNIFFANKTSHEIKMYSWSLCLLMPGIGTACMRDMEQWHFMYYFIADFSPLFLNFSLAGLLTKSHHVHNVVHSQGMKNAMFAYFRCLTHCGWQHSMRPKWTPNDGLAQNQSSSEHARFVFIRNCLCEVSTFIWMK